MKMWKPKQKENEFEVLTEQGTLVKLFRFIKLRFQDSKVEKADGKFRDFALDCYVGEQGSGKSTSMVERLEQIRRDYPQVKIMTNFGYGGQDEPLTDWQQLIDCRNGDDGIVFAIDEIQNEFDKHDTRNFNLDILKVVTQQRKQGIKILATSQVFTSVSKPLREQCYTVVECRTVAGRWTFQRAFDAREYNYFVDNPNPEKKAKVRRKWTKNFVQSDKIRGMFDSYAVIESMKKLLKDETKKRMSAA